MKTLAISIPGSKSITNRALILAALGSGKTTLENAAICDDTAYMISGLKKLGIKIKQTRDKIEIEGCGGNFTKSEKPIEIYTGNAGTTTRFLTALATITGNKVIINGDSRMSERPIAELSKALNNLGAKIDTANGCPPLIIHPQNLKGGEVSVAGNISSQYLSALLMIAPFAEKDTIIKIEKELFSKPYIAMTLKVMEEFGIKIKNKNFIQFEINSARINLKKTKGVQKKYTVESDASSASYIGAYAALQPTKKILIKNIFPKSLQGDIKFLDYLKKMGCKISEQKNGTLIKGPKVLKALGNVDMNSCPDIVMTFAVLAMFSPGKTKIINIANLRIKETDRIQAMENEIKKIADYCKLPIEVKTGKDWIEIDSKKLSKTDSLKTNFVQNNRLEFTPKSDTEKKKYLSQGSKIQIETYNDHRMAMSFGILLDLLPLEITNPNCVSKSYTTFWEDLKKLSK